MIESKDSQRENANKPFQRSSEDNLKRVSIESNRLKENNPNLINSQLRKSIKKKKINSSKMVDSKNYSHPLISVVNKVNNKNKIKISLRKEGINTSNQRSVVIDQTMQNSKASKKLNERESNPVVLFKKKIVKKKTKNCNPIKNLSAKILTSFYSLKMENYKIGHLIGKLMKDQELFQL